MEPSPAADNQPSGPQHNRSTSGQHKYQGEQRLLQAVKLAWPTPLNAKAAALQAHVSYDRARHLLPHMARSGDLAQAGRGWYTLPKPPDAEVDLRIENLVLVARQHNAIARASDPVSQTSAFQSRIDVISRKVRMPGWQGAEYDETRTWYGPYTVYIRAYRNGTTTVQLGANGGPSLSMFDFLGFCGWLTGHFEDVPDDGPLGWHVKQFELNHDFKDLHLDGASHFSLRLFRNVLLKLYQKPTGLRLELRATSVDVTIAQMRQMAEDLAGAYLKLGLVEVRDGGRS